MLDVLKTILYPIIWIMTILLEAFNSVLGSHGLSIILLSFAVFLVTYPFVKIGTAIESKHRKLAARMEPKIDEIKRKYKGEKRFLKIEKVYEEHNFHPIKSVFSASGFLFQLPFLISSMLLLISYTPLQGKGFAFISDLSQPDQLLTLFGVGINLLPVAVSGVAISESFIAKDTSKGDRNKFIFISLALFLLIYFLPSAIVLYWLCSNIWSFGLALKRQNDPIGDS